MSLLKMAASAAFVVSLVACGGGSSSDGDPPFGGGGGGTAASPAGLYAGTSGSGTNLREFSVLLLDTGRFYALYTGPAGGTPAYIAGVVVGDGATSGNSFNASTVRDFNFEGEGVTQGSLTSTFVEDTSITGAVSAPGGTVTFSASYDAAYDLTPSLGTLVGGYTGQVASSAGVEDAALSIAANGSLTAISSGGCSVTGTVSLHASGNVYDASLTFGAGCVQPNGTTFNGHAYLDASEGVLYAVVANAGSTDGVLFVGTRN